ncbi:hypothetical protein NTB88_14470 [Aeromonas salmonicida]|nr:hypothetical protein [Aeromonas salmonicida]
MTALPANQDAPQVSARMAAFMAEELLPLMAGCWPASANQLNDNAHGVALAWGRVLSGFTPAQIRDAVQCMATEAERQFAPRPAEVLAEIFRRLPAAAPAESTRLAISIRACEMEATVTVLQRDGVVTDGAVQVELERIITERRQRGYTITGRI